MKYARAPKMLRIEAKLGMLDLNQWIRILLRFPVRTPRESFLFEVFWDIAYV